MIESNHHVPSVKAITTELLDAGVAVIPVYPRTAAVDLYAGDVAVKVRAPAGVRTAGYATRAAWFTALSAADPLALMVVRGDTSKPRLWEVWCDVSVLSALIAGDVYDAVRVDDVPVIVRWEKMLNILAQYRHLRLSQV